jgi:hypothetical protein
VFTLGQVLTRQRLNDHRQMNARIEPQRGEKIVAQMVTRYGGQLQVVGARRVLGEVFTGEAFLLLQQRDHGRILLGEKTLQRLDGNRWRIAQRRQCLQRQIAAHRVVRPAPRRRGRGTKQQQEKGQLHCF